MDVHPRISGDNVATVTEALQQGLESWLTPLSPAVQLDTTNVSLTESFYWMWINVIWVLPYVFLSYTLMESLMYNRIRDSEIYFDISFLRAIRMFFMCTQKLEHVREV